MFVSAPPTWKQRAARFFSFLIGTHRRPPAKADPYPVFLTDLLQRHGHSDIVQDARGVGCDGSPNRLNLRLVTIDAGGGGFIAQVAATLQFPTGPTLADVATGFGGSAEQAHELAVNNYLLSTFHVFQQAAFPRGETRQRVLDCHGRPLIQGDLICIGDEPPRPDEALSQQLGDLLRSYDYPKGPQIIKLVHSPKETILTVGSTEVKELNEAIRALLWPGHERLFVAKQLLLLQDS